MRRQTPSASELATSCRATLTFLYGRVLVRRMVPLDEAETYLSSKGLLDQPGIVLYSGAETLVSGPVYLLG